MVVKVSKPEINVREKISELDKPSGTAGQAMLAAETPQEQFNLINAGRRNLLINGDFQISQRGNYTTASSANVSYFVDRWYTDVANAVSVNKQHITGINIPDTSFISKGVRLVATSSGVSYTGIRQKIENPTQYIGRTFTYSGWVRSNTPNARLTSYGSGSPNQAIVSEPHSGSGDWEKLSVTFELYSNVSNGWYVSAFISTSGIGSVAQVPGDYIEVTQLQVELGKVATPFEHRSHGEELALCERYYQNSFDAGEAPNVISFNCIYLAAQPYSGGNIAGLSAKLSTSMRATPSVTIWTASPSWSNTANRMSYYSGGWANAAVTLHESTSSKIISIGSSGVSSSTKLIQFNFEADAEL
jgi:hypothetical protein